MEPSLGLLAIPPHEETILMALQSPGGAGIVVNNWSASHRCRKGPPPFFSSDPTICTIYATATDRHHLHESMILVSK